MARERDRTIRKLGLILTTLGLYFGVTAAQSGQDTRGLFPVVFNLATRARITANATCGEREPEVFCKLVEHVQIFPAANRHCDRCDANSHQPLQRHPIQNAIDGSHSWWQSPTLTNGEEFNTVTITLDLGSIYQVAYVIVKAANSPRPGNWILERSIDGQTYMPWQYFAMTDQDCVSQYGVQPTVGVPTSLGDDQVICTSRYSRLDPLENGEIFVSIVNGRPGVFQPSRVLLDFTSARYVRLRLLKIRTLNADLMFFRQFSSYKDLDPTVTRRYFYSIKDISIGGQCICYGHATFCRRHDIHADRLQCQCQHNTGGDNCEQCLPLFNQRPWRTGGIQGLGCEECNCHGKAVACVYNATVDARKLSLNKQGLYEGGGVCLNCQEFTTGINCEKCIDGYYRPHGFTPSVSNPCRPCNCYETATSTSRCVLDSSRTHEGLNPGDCICKPGFGGPSCRECAFGYYGYPNCQQCPCNPAGSRDPSYCRRPCDCKTNVGGGQCEQCRPGFFNLDRNDPDGCTECFCFGVTTVCKSAKWGLLEVKELNGWMLSTLDVGGLTLLPRYFDGWLEAKTYLLNVNNINFNIAPTSSGYRPSSEVHYWLAPMVYLGNRLSSYGGYVKYTVKFTLDPSLPNRFHLADPDLILKGGGMTIAHGRQYQREELENMVAVRLTEDEWYHVDTRQSVSRQDFMMILYNLQQLMIKATYHTGQDTVYLRDVILEVASPLVSSNRTLPSVEQCQCPEGYAGLSCESCSPGWRRVDNQLNGGVCERCSCNNHATECDPQTGACQACKHNTMGHNCELCQPGFYGDPRHGTENDCQTCACPLMTGNNFFAESCRANPTATDRTGYQCVNCQEGYEGDHCQRCSPGYYGNPLQPGGRCRRCNCGGNINLSVPGSCDPVTGACMICANNTEGQYCEKCRQGYYGSAHNGDCRPCACSQEGSYSDTCDQRTGQCNCRSRFIGRQCDQCQPGYGDISQGCVRCSCSVTGSQNRDCDPVTGRCQCRQGVGGQQCDRCAEGYFGYSQYGCQRCDCYSPGTNEGTQCDPRSGRCLCRPNVIGERCDQCQVGYYGIDRGQGCMECACSQVGSTSYQCDPRTAQCPCHHGIGGRACDQCLPGYFGFSSSGCQRCEPCNKPGHICDPNTGKCVCPPNTEGPNCERCKNKAYDFKDMGCKLCNCTEEGSASQQCDSVSGECVCLPGFHGFSCDKCTPGFYGFPQCSACNCSMHGSDPDTCSEGGNNCQCDNFGQCQCKTNVEGENCDQCAPGTFSLQGENPKGCTECYCFFRSQQCEQAPYVWTTVTVPTMKVTINPQGLVSPPIVGVGGYRIINSTHVAANPSIATVPLYWAMPDMLRGDMITSYNGQLDFIHFFDHSSSARIISPLVVLQGNGFEIHGDPSSLEPNHADSFNVRFHESFWRLPGQQPPVTRRLMMVVLQNVTAFLIRATQDGHASYAEIGPINLQVAKPRKNANDTGAIAFGVEQCACPDRYSGLSCQNPGNGYFRVRPDPNSNNVLAPEGAIGHVRPCQCYSHSNTCHPETGVCQDCQHNTTGDNCDECVPGYYGIATRGTPDDCSPCTCPLEERSNNFSPTCSGAGNKLMCTNCTKGYTGTRCERCDQGYYGNPTKLGEKCEPCMCNPEGTVGNKCDPVTGQCRCIPGIEGRRCDGCVDPNEGVQNGVCISCYTGCTGELLNDLKNLTIPDAFINITGAIYPWEDLYKIKNETKDLQDRMDALKSTSLKDVKDLTDEVDFHKNIAGNLYNRLNFTNSKVGIVRHKTKDTKLNATDVENLVNELLKEIKGNISQLRELVEKLYHNQTGINVTAALAEAKDILNTILARDFKDDDRKALDEGWRAEELSERVREMHRRTVNTSDVEKAIQSLEDALQDLHNSSTQAKAKALEVIDEHSQKLGGLIADIEDKLLDLQDLKTDTENMLKEGRELNADAENALKRLNDNILSLQNQLYTLKEAKKELDKQFAVLKAAMPKLEQLFRDAWKHALDLENSATHLRALFDEVKNLAEDPMRAARAYQSIVQAIKQADNAAKKALQTAKDSVDIAKVNDLEAEVKASLERSRQLLKQADKLMDEGVTALSDTLQDMQTNVDNVEKKHQSAVDLLNMLKDGLSKVPKGFGARLNEILRKIDLAVVRANDANVTVSNIQYGIDTILWPRLQQLQNFDINAIIFNVNQNTDTASKEAKFIKDNIPTAKKEGQNNMRDVVSISTKISELRRKIDEARNITNSMKLSLSGEGGCVRSYRSQLAPGVTNEVRLGLKLNRTGVDMLLLLLQESSQEYLALEIKNNKVHFSWNVGKGPGSVTHDLELRVFDSNEDEGEKWYRILAKRVGPIGQLKVWPVKGSEKNAKEVTGKSASGFSLINFNRNTSVYISGVEDSHQVPSGVTRNKLYGCVGDVTIDGKPLGVYNFKSSEGQCKACFNVPKQQPSTSVYSFNGNGYARLPILNFNYNAERFDIVLEFKTFWENSRLFFAGNPQGGDFVSLDLVGGKIFAQFYLGGMSKGTQETTMTYNTNQWTYVKVKRNKLKAVVQTFVDGQQEENIFFDASGPNTDLNILGQHMYIGGLPDSFDLDKFPQKDIRDTRNFLGCLKNFGIGGFNAIPLDLTTGTMVGISPGCKDTNVHQVGFYDNGYVVFDGVSLGPSADISLSFFTKQQEALLLLARDVKSDYFYSIALKDGKLEARLAANSPQTVLQSTKKYNDGAVHYVALLKEDRNIQMLVDDILVASGTLPVGVTEIPMDVNSNLYFGGAQININDMAASDKFLDGCISDIIANGRLIDLGKAKQYKLADIGRCRDSVTYANGETGNICENGNFVAPTQPLPVVTRRAVITLPSRIDVTTTPAAAATTPPMTVPPLTATSTLPPTSTCSPFRLMNAGIENNAKTLGNSQNSFAKISRGIQRSELRKNFNITFEFRTFFYDGLFGLLKNVPQTVYFAAQLRGGMMEVVFSFRGGVRKLRSSDNLADGQWHNCQIIKDKMKMMLYVDGQLVGSEKIESRLEIELPLYIGGLPTEEELKISDVVKHSLRGCVRNLQLGGRPVDMTDTDIISGVEHCYVDVEPGVGFISQSWGVFDEEFDVGSNLVIEVEFKSSEREGVLLSVSNSQGDVGLTLELHDGKMLFTLKNNEETLQAESKNIDPNEFCRSQWHTVRAALFGKYLQLSVDSKGDVFATAKTDNPTTPSQAVLLIGGIPSMYKDQPASSSQRGLYGCMRNVIINGYKVDWYKLEMVGSLLRTACPL